MSDETASGATPSGQLGPKSKIPHSKFKEYSEQPKPSDRLQEGAPPVGGADKESRRIEKSAFRVEKTGAKLETAIEKRNKKKPQKNPGVVKSVRKMAQYELYRYAHGKVQQAENENAGIEAAHKSEMAGERVARGTSRFVKQRNRTRPARRVQKWEKREIKAKADLQYRKLTKEHPELKKNALSRYMQKKRMQKRYQKQAREATKKGAKAAKNAAVTTEKITVSVVKFFAARPHVLLIAVIVVLLIITLQSCMGMFGALGGGGAGTVGGIGETAEAVYTQLETELQLSIDNMETSNPGYDEYRRTIGSIGHNPAELLGFLAVRDSFTEAEIDGIMRNVFNAQYTLATAELTEERETVNEDGETVTEEIRILEITLTARTFTEAIAANLTPEQLEQFNRYNYS